MAHAVKLKRLAENSEVDAIVAKARTAIWALRDREKVTQANAAERLGLSLRTLSRNESKGDIPSVTTLSKLVGWAHTSGYSDLEADFRDILARRLRVRFGNSSVYLGEDRYEGVRKLLHSFQDLWQLFRPAMNETEQQVHSRLGELLDEIAKEVSR